MPLYVFRCEKCDQTFEKIVMYGQYERPCAFEGCDGRAKQELSSKGISFRFNYLGED